MNKPQPLLRVREWRPARFPLRAVHRRDDLSVPIPVERFNISGQLIHGRMLKERAHRQLYLQCFPHTRDNLSRQQGVPA